MPTPARRLAFRILRQVSGRGEAQVGGGAGTQVGGGAGTQVGGGAGTQVGRDGGTLADQLAQPDAEALPSRERAFLHELVLGTLRHRGALDHALAPLLDRPLRRLDGAVLAALRLGAYQILRLRVPDRAAVSESVDLIQDAQPRAAGFVNAVLRRLAREGPPSEPDPGGDPLAWLTTAGSLPRWLAERWVSRFGAQAAVEKARAFLETPPAVFRLNPRAVTAEKRIRSLDPLPLLVPGAWRATAGDPAALAAEGLLYLQDEGSQMVAHLAAAPGRLLDACAAPGGKSMLLGDLVGETGRILAAEASLRRLRTLVALLRRWGSTNVLPLGADALRPPFRGDFHAVLLDAPCTGLGTIGRHPDIRWRVTPEHLVGQARRQRNLLDSVARLVRDRGLLVYATCSSEPEEGEQVVEAFLAGNPHFAPEALPGWATPFAQGPFARTSPERGGDVFFAALLRRSG